VPSPPVGWLARDHEPALARRRQLCSPVARPGARRSLHYLTGVRQTRVRQTSVRQTGVRQTGVRQTGVRQTAVRQTGRWLYGKRADAAAGLARPAIMKAPFPR
jgi:hypothetical protein